MPLYGSWLDWDALPLLPVTLTWVITLPGRTFLALSKHLCSGPQSPLNIDISQSTYRPALHQYAQIVSLSTQGLCLPPCCFLNAQHSAWNKVGAQSMLIMYSSNRQAALCLQGQTHCQVRTAVRLGLPCAPSIRAISLRRKYKTFLFMGISH